MKMLNLKVFILAAIVGHFSQAQISTIDLPDFHPVSPNAASLGKFGIYPAANNLGSVPISIPIYSISERKINVPIALNYNTSGVRLNELASWVGLGWSLSAGGAIVRNTKGLPDRGFTEPIPNLENAAFTNENYGYMLNASRGQSDTAPDQYVLNALGVSGSFYFDRSTGEAEFEDGSPLHVETISPEEIQVTLENGTLLVFGIGADGSNATEVTNSNLTDPFYVADFISTWYLTEVYSPDRLHRVSFKYKYNTAGDSNLAIWRDYAQPSSESVTLDGAIPSTATAFLSGRPGALPTIRKKYLEKIIFGTGYIDFESSLSRQDLMDDFRLDAIKVYTHGGTLVDEFYFSYDYFMRTGGVYPKDYELGPIYFSDTRQAQSRDRSLRLTAFTRGPVGSQEVHAFDYNPTVLPRRCTTAQDSWGFPNGNTGSLMPQTLTSIESLGTKDFLVGNGDRSVDEVKAKAGVLEKITYPTGGYTVFEYESNRIIETLPQYNRKSHNVIVYGNGQDVSGNDCGPHEEGATFIIPQDAINIKLSIALSPVDYQESGVEGSYVAIDNKKFYRPTPNSSGGPQDSSDGWYETIDLFFGYNLGDPLNLEPLGPGEHTLFARDTGYGSVATGVGASGCTSMSISISWEQPSTPQEVETLFGGLRVASITNFDGDQAEPATVRMFEYEHPNVIHPIRNRGFVRKYVDGSSLKARVSTSPHYNNNLEGEPALEYGTVTEFLYNPNTQKNEGKTVYTYESVPPIRIFGDGGLGTAFAHPLFSYTFAYDDQQNNIFQQTGVWSLLLRAIYGLEDFSYYETTSWQRGSLSAEAHYKIDNHQEVLLQETAHTYETINTLAIKNNYVQLNFAAVIPQSFNVPSPYDQNLDYHSLAFTYKIDEVQLGRKRRVSTVTTKYDDQGQNPVSVVEHLHYDNPQHMQLSRMEMTDSKGITQITKYYYPDDVANAQFLEGGDLTTVDYNTIAELKADRSTRRIGEVIQTEQYSDLDGDDLAEGAELLAIQRNVFSDFGGQAILPSKQLFLKGPEDPSRNLDERVIFHSYDDGSPTELSRADDSHQVLIWGYNKTLLIARIQNATLSDIPGSVIADLQSKSDADDDSCLGGQSCNEQVLRDALQGLRSLPTLSNAMVTTYTHNPLEGLTSQVDPNGLATYYEYDVNGRLSAIRDTDENLLQRYEYHFKGQ